MGKRDKTGIPKPPLPVIDGVGPSRIGLPDGTWNTILEFLINRFPDVSSATWIDRMERQTVVDENGVPVQPDTAYRRGSSLHYYREIREEKTIPGSEEVLYCDNNILIADKPHFLPVSPVGNFLRETLLVRLRRTHGFVDLAPVHRIDRETAGLVMFSCNRKTCGYYAGLFRNRQIKKVYEALAPSRDSISFPLTRRSRIVQGEPFLIMKEAEGEPNAETHIDVIRREDEMTRYRLVPVTGRRHQLRIHLAALGIPIVNDRWYPSLDPQKEDDYDRPLKLLAKSLSFCDPFTGCVRSFESKKTL